MKCFDKPDVDMMFNHFSTIIKDELKLIEKRDSNQIRNNILKNDSYLIPSLWFTDVILDCLFTLQFLNSSSKETLIDNNGNFIFNYKNSVFPKPILLTTEDTTLDLFYSNFQIDNLKNLYSTNAKSIHGFYKKFNLLKGVVSNDIHENYIIEKSTHAGYIYNAKELLKEFDFIDKSSNKLKTIKITNYGIEYKISLEKYLKKVFKFKGSFCRCEILKMLCIKIKQLENKKYFTNISCVLLSPLAFDYITLESLDLTANIHLNNRMYTKVRKRVFYDICEQYHKLYGEDYMQDLMFAIEALFSNSTHSKIEPFETRALIELLNQRLPEFIDNWMYSKPKLIDYNLKKDSGFKIELNTDGKRCLVESGANWHGLKIENSPSIKFEKLKGEDDVKKMIKNKICVELPDTTEILVFLKALKPVNHIILSN